jgi:Zn-dependent protease
VLGNPRVFIVSAIFLIPGILIAIPVHELAHVFAARAMGDETPRRQGYLRSWRNWFSPYGVATALIFRVGWGEAAPVNERSLDGPVRKLAWALAGPAANLVLAIPFAIAARVIADSNGGFDPSTWVQPPVLDLEYLLYALYFFNLAMFAFNLLPIPGLDGWRVLEALFRGVRPKFFFDASLQRRQVWTICAVALFLSYFIGINLLGWVMSPFFHPASTLIIGSCQGYPGLTPCLP